MLFRRLREGQEYVIPLDSRGRNRRAVVETGFEVYAGRDGRGRKRPLEGAPRPKMKVVVRARF
jgi:hypothetical protein